MPILKKISGEIKKFHKMMHEVYAYFSLKVILFLPARKKSFSLEFVLLTTVSYLSYSHSFSGACLFKFLLEAIPDAKDQATMNLAASDVYRSKRRNK